MNALVVPDIFAATDDPAWIIEDDTSDPLRESSRESRFAVSNGFLGVRCSRAINQNARLALPPRTYVAGLFDTAGPEAPVSALVPAADWLQLTVTANVASSPDSAVAPHRLILDMKRGLLLTECRRMDGTKAALCIRTLHFVSLHARSIGVQYVELTVGDAEMDVMLEASVDQTSLGLLGGNFDLTSSVWRTKESGKRLGMAMSSSLAVAGRAVQPVASGPLSSTWHWTSSAGDAVRFERTVALTRSDTPLGRAGAAARGELDLARQRGREALLADHEEAWMRRWEASDVVVEGDAAAQRALRFAVYALNSAADPTDDTVSIGARALTGEDYHGHVFWDTEIYLLPFYIMTWPAAARAMLMYRFHTLAGARAKAARMGYRGALYAWESAGTGDETAPEHVIGPDREIVPILSGREEQHISADVAYAVWQYWQATRDESFLLSAGAEILFETARFWVSRSSLEADGLRHIRGVIGPDEYHEGIDDNAFTNVMARWNIRRALDVAALLRSQWPERFASLTRDLQVEDGELEQWRISAQEIATGFDPTTGLFEQFAGYFKLEDIDLAAYAGRSVPMDVVLGRDRTQRSQVVKQADVVALLALLPDEFPGDAARANFAYYEPRCGHGSSLSRAQHAFVAARLGNFDMAFRYFEETAAIDLCDTNAAIGGGLHIAAQGGVWLTAVFGFSGLSLLDDAVALNPRIPAGWRRLTYRVQWRGRHMKIDIDGASDKSEVTLEAGDPMPLVVRGRRTILARETPFRTDV